MSHIPDCREDETYNQKYLGKHDKSFVHGFDWCAEMATDTFFDNLETYFGIDSHIEHLLNEPVPEAMQEEYEWVSSFGTEGDKPVSEKRNVKTYLDLLRVKMIDWIESERNQLITSMIDGMSSEEYEKNKKEAEENE